MTLLNHNSHKRNSRHSIIIAVTVAVLVAALSIIVFSSGSAIQANEDRQACKMYTSIKIEQGDTLWDIASRYIDGHYSSIQEYINEVKSINELTSDTIHAEAYLLVPYYQA